MKWLPDIFSVLSLMAVIAIGYKTLQLGQRSAKASEASAEASIQAAQATERSVIASEKAARLAAHDAQVRRIMSVLDVVLEMRELFNEQVSPIVNKPVGPISRQTVQLTSPEKLSRLALSRKLKVRLVPFENKVQESSPLRSLVEGLFWNTNDLEGAITELKGWIKEAISPN